MLSTGKNYCVHPSSIPGGNPEQHAAKSDAHTVGVAEGQSSGRHENVPASQVHRQLFSAIVSPSKSTLSPIVSQQDGPKQWKHKPILLLQNIVNIVYVATIVVLSEFILHALATYTWTHDKQGPSR